MDDDERWEYYNDPAHREPVGPGPGLRRRKRVDDERPAAPFSELEDKVLAEPGAAEEVARYRAEAEAEQWGFARQFREWWSTDPVFAIDETTHRLPWRVHALLFSWWLCDLVDLRLGMTWRELLRDRKTRTPQWRDALRHWGK